jgi:hypothetical protein
MQHDINFNLTRNREYRPYIFGENTTWNTSLYDPYRSVDFGLYSKWDYAPTLCRDQHNCFDRLASTTEVQDVKSYGTQMLQNQDDGVYVPGIYQSFGSESSGGKHSSNNLYRRLYTL